LSQIQFNSLTFYNNTPFFHLSSYSVDTSFNNGFYGLYLYGIDGSGNFYETQPTPYIADYLYNTSNYNGLNQPYFSNQYIFNMGNNGTTGSKIFVYTQSGTIVSTDFYNSVNGTSYNYIYQGPLLLDSYNNVFYQSINGNFGSGKIFVSVKVLCFKENSKILTLQGYKLIQELKEGDLIKTYAHGYKPIYKIGCNEINHLCSEERNTNKLYKCSTEKFPELFEDLVITGCHSILVDNFKYEEERQKTIEIHDGKLCMTDDKYRLPACADKRTTIYEISGSHKIYHFALENDDYYENYGVFANGLLVESTSKRLMDTTSMSSTTLNTIAS